MNKDIADLFFPNIANGIEKNREYFENLYKKRDVASGQEYTRIAPSPTGELHTGALYVAMINEIVAHKNNGKMIVRIEDTDKVREIDGAKNRMMQMFEKYEIKIDESFLHGGEYGPYVQSERTHIYNAFLHDFLLQGFAYPCFMTSEELEKMREEQTIMKVRPGVYGKYAASRSLTSDEIKNKIESGEKYVIRLKSSGNFENKVTHVDEIMGKLELSENDEDFVIAKGDGIPTYHFAHLIDDYTMGITYVIRANEWVASITKHLELWNKLGVKPIKYGHIMPINKKDGSSIRKLSKRKDREASVAYYLEQGYTTSSVKAYLLRLANPGFDEWWDAEVIASTSENREINISNYNFNFDELKRNSRGPLLDFDKLNNMSADMVGSYSKGKASTSLLTWTKQYDIDFYNVISKGINYLEEVMNIERTGETKRKDIYAWSIAKYNMFYMWDELYQAGEIENNKLEILSEISKSISEDKYFDLSIDIPEWIKCFKDICVNNEVLSRYKFGEIMMIIRKKITSLEKTPNLYFIFNVLGREKTLSRFK